MALDLDVFVLCRRERRHVEAFLETYADPTQLEREIDGLSISLDPPLDEAVPVRTQREGIELGLEHPAWAFVSYLPAAVTAPTDQCCVAFTVDGHAILGLNLVDPGSGGDDGQDVDPVPVLERLVADHHALAGFIGWEVTPFGTAREFEEMLRGERSAGVGEIRRDLPRFLGEEWLVPRHDA